MAAETTRTFHDAFPLKDSTDLVLLSSNHTHFATHNFILQNASSFFRDLLSIPQPPEPQSPVAPVADDPKVIPMDEDAKTLEGIIWSWELPETQGGSSLSRATIPADRLDDEEDDDDNAHLDSQHSRSMILAIHQALLIYFYRRVYNMNAMLLQDRVRQTLDYLEPCLTLEWWIEDQDFATSLAWSVFIAACEAVLPVLRQRALDILTTIDNRGIFFTSAPPTEVVTAIWQRRRVLKTT